MDEHPSSFEHPPFCVSTHSLPDLLGENVLLTLPRPVELPVSLNEDNTWYTRTVMLDKMQNNVLLDLLKSYGLSTPSRSRKAYISELRRFGEDRSLWERLRAPIRRAHKGPGSHRNNISHSSTTMLVDSTPVEQTHSSPSTRPQDRIHAGLTMAPMRPNAQFCSVVPPDTTSTESEIQADALYRWAMEASATALVPPDLSHTRESQSSMITYLSTALSEILPLLRETSEVLPLLRRLVDSAQQTMSGSLSQPEFTHLSIPDTTPPPTSPADIPSATYGGDDISAGCVTDNGHDQLPLLLEMNLQKLRYNESDVPSPRTLRVTTDIADLDAMWDDYDSERWTEKSPLRVRGVSIPLIYCRDLYCYRRSNDWTYIKQKWWDWKILVDEYRHLGPSEFWSFYSSDNARLTKTKILAKIKTRRQREDKELADLAVQANTNTYSERFRYRRGSRTYVLTKPSAIARRYRKINDPEQGFQ
ncbi:hypothetical protein C8Q80DRAFT_1124127 [Daedaleopsis nitida]|nr:hypothetical protein C8Q80DRAFT_1124127 [Daedaleopsis nitida]